MAKRFTDSRKFQDPWYRKLAPKYKLLWDYILCTCNHAGIWKVDFEMAAFCIGAGSYEIDECIKILSNRVRPLGEEKWFIPKYITFQYGDIDTNKSKACLSAIDALKKERVKELLPNSYQTIKDMVKDKDKNKVLNDLDKDKVLSINNTKYFEEIWKRYPNRIGRKAAERHFLTSVKTQTDWESINRALDNYLKSERVQKGFVQNGSTWFNNWQDWINKPIKELDNFESNIKRS